MKSDQSFLDRLMMKNFSLYQNEHGKRLRFQDHSADIYRKAHQNDKTFNVLAYEDEIRAKQNSLSQSQRLQMYEHIVTQKK